MKSTIKTTMTGIVLLLSISAFAQQAGRSASMQMNLVQPYVRGLPPNIFAELQFVDDNGNGFLYLLKLDNNILVFTDARGKLLVGDEDFDYTLNKKW